jgi:hypothetical protein
MQAPRWGTIARACKDIGGEEEPIHPSTFYRGVAAGRYSKPEHPSPGISRVDRDHLAKEIVAGHALPKK